MEQGAIQQWTKGQYNHGARDDTTTEQGARQPRGMGQVNHMKHGVRQPFNRGQDIRGTGQGGKVTMEQ